MYKYNAALSNNQCVFDSRDDFASISDVLVWSKGRGGKYVIQIDSPSAATCGISIAYDDDANTYSHYDGWEWISVSHDKVESYIKEWL